MVVGVEQKQDLLFRIGHRDRLRQKFIDNQLSDDELLELLLADVIPRRDVRPLARGLMKHFGGISQVLTASLEDLMNYPGIGKNTAVHIKLVNKIMAQGYKERLHQNPIFHDNATLINYCLTAMMGKQIEELHVLYLDEKLRLLADDTNSIGTIDWAPIFEREIVKRALNLNAYFVLLLHNHPVPEKGFSTDDIEGTESLMQKLAPFNLHLYDHFLVSDGKITSAREKFFIK